MKIKNFESKVKVDRIEKYESILLKLNRTFKGFDHQIDTYFNANKGRLKLREGNIENSLINYDRQNISGSKLSVILLYQHGLTLL